MGDGKPQPKGAKAVEAALRYPAHRFTPEELLTFIEMDGFLDDWLALGLNDDELLALQIIIMSHPKAGPVVKGTGGLRKLRFKPPSWKRGKSGALRVGYAFLEAFGIVLLIIVYAKNEMDDIPAAARKAIMRMIARQRELLSKRPYK